MQCTAGNEHEFPDLKERHRENIDFDCFVAMHVGCARWGVTEADGAAIKHRRTYFCPCRDPVLAEMYCNAHAAEIAQNKPKKIPPPTRPPSLPPKCPLVRPKPSSTNPKKDITAIFSTDTIVSKITKDVLHHISCAEAKKKSNLPEVTKERKKYWKNKMEGESDKFREIWSLVKKQVLEHRKETTETQNDTKMSTLRRGSSDESEGSKRSSGAGKIRQRSSESFAAILDDKNPRKRGSDSSGASIGKAIMASLENMGGKERRGSNSSIQYIAEDGGLKKRGSNESLTSLRNGESKKRRGSNSTILSIAEDEEPKRRGSDESFTSLGNGENKKRRGSNTSIPSIAEDEEIKRRGSITSWSSLKNGTGKKRRASNSSIPSVPEDKKSEKLWSNESFTLLGNGENKKRRGSNTSIQSIAEDEEPKKPGINESIASTGMKLPPIPNDDEGSRQHIAMEETEKKGSQDFSTSLGQKLQDDLLGDILGHPRRRSDSLKAVNDPVVPDIEIIDVDADDEVIIDPPPQEKNSKGSDIGAMLPSKDLTYNNMHTAVTEKERKKVLEMSRGESMTQDMAMGGGMPSSSTGPSMDRAESWESGGSCGNGPAASNLLKENGFSSTNAGTSQELSLKDVSSSDMEQQLEPLTETNPFLHLFVPYFQGAMYDMSKMWEITEIIHHGLPPDEI
uniref:Uncharacterized protein n=1 Tax=Corethron hystrix TaxID=216773 RepID=A0A7S1B410_9STRA|mmetsp:Transcript_12097/g.26486  ORF Transcript_12097/g.26486 Transcript_12097/m.26486 type:complete len:678 (+) Transcript_12097:395-2428(+)